MEPRRQSSFSRRLRRQRSRDRGEVLSLPGEAMDIGESDAPLALPAPTDDGAAPPFQEVAETAPVPEGDDDGWPVEAPSPQPSPSIRPSFRAPEAAATAVESVTLNRRRRPGAARPPGAALRAAAKPVLLLLALFGAGAAGYGLRAARTPAERSLPTPAATAAAVVAAPSPSPRVAPEPVGPPEAQVAAAYALLKERRFPEARAGFLALVDGAPPGSELRASLKHAVAWAELSGGDASSAERSLRAQVQDREAGADTHFLLGITHLLQGRYSETKAAFARAVALDPTRGDVHFLWGDALRREGRPRESIERFEAALHRNRLETNEGFYQFKLWLSQLQVGGAEAEKASTTIDSVLRRNPASSGLTQAAAAARALSQNRPAEALEAMRRARLTLDPLIFGLVIQDPSFSQESWRPEWAEFFRK